MKLLFKTFLLTLSVGYNTFATTWDYEKVACPYSKGDTCVLVNIASYGGYIYNYYPDRLNYVFWPITMKEWVVTCNSCGWAVFRNDFDKLKNINDSAINNLPLITNVGDKVLNTLRIIGGDKKDSAFILRWILQESIPVSLSEDSLYQLELRLLSELYTEAKTKKDSCYYWYLIGRYTLLKGDTASSVSYFKDIIWRYKCDDHIKRSASENYLTCQSGKDIKDEYFRYKLGCFLYDSIGMKNEETALLYLNVLVSEYNRIGNNKTEEEIIKIAELYGKGYTSKAIFEILERINNKSDRLIIISKNCKKNANSLGEKHVIRFARIFSVVVSALLIVLVVCWT